MEVEEGCDNLVSKVCGVTFVNCSDMYRGGKYANGPMNSQGYVSGTERSCSRIDRDLRGSGML